MFSQPSSDQQSPLSEGHSHRIPVVLFVEILYCRTLLDVHHPSMISTMRSISIRFRTPWGILSCPVNSWGSSQLLVPEHWHWVLWVWWPWQRTLKCRNDPPVKTFLPVHPLTKAAHSQWSHPTATACDEHAVIWNLLNEVYSRWEHEDSLWVGLLLWPDALRPWLLPSCSLR